jgi:hypothetical protein
MVFDPFAQVFGPFRPASGRGQEPVDFLLIGRWLSP